MGRRWFGTDGVRGVAGLEPLTPERLLALGRAVGHWIAQQGEGPHRVVIGQDTRWSCSPINAAFSAGLCAEGVEVLQLGVIPTPAVAWLTTHLHASAGAMISASHNPFQDNGIKLIGPDGFKLSDEVELAIEQLWEHPQVSSSRTGVALGRIEPFDQAAALYMDHLVRSLEGAPSLAGLKVVVDAGNGAASNLVMPLLESLGMDVIPMAIHPDGVNINAGVGALHPQAVQARVLETGAHIGVALDGDADRAILVDEKGAIRDGDACLAVCASRWLTEGKLPTKQVVATQMSNLGLEQFLAHRGIGLLRANVGDRYVMEAMRQGGHPIGGEQSGHVIFLDHATTGDGLLTLLQVMRVMAIEQMPLSQLLSDLKRFPQLLKNLRFTRRAPLNELPEVMKAIGEAESTLAGRGRVLVRFSGTEPLARVMVEGTSDEENRQLADRILDALAAALA